MSAEELLAADAQLRAVHAGDMRATARLISMIEREDPSRVAVLKALHAFSGRAHIMGVTGPPGAGKSTLTDKIISELRLRGRKVGIIAVDPSSPFTGGAILGDRIRMMRHSGDDGVFIRSLATRGHLGGLSRATAETVRVLDAAGYDDVIIETVGVGQSEVDIVRLADTVVLVAVPGLGDDIQALKAGVMEIGDVFCVNKADRDGSERVVREIRSMMETAAMNGAATRFSELYSSDRLDAPERKPGGDSGLGHHRQASIPGHPNLTIPPVLATIAETGAGVPELVKAIQEHYRLLSLSGLLNQRRLENTEWELSHAAAERVLLSFHQHEKHKKIMELARDIVDKNIDFYEALELLTEDLTL